MKQFRSYLLINRVDPGSFKYLFSIKIEAQTISWKDRLSSTFSYAISFISLALKLHSREVTQSVPKELQVNTRNRKDALPIPMEEEEAEDSCGKPFGENYIHLSLFIISLLWIYFALEWVICDF